IVWLSVQRSGRTSIRATTRSVSASVKVTPFNSANGIFIDWIFSSGVITKCSMYFRSPCKSLIGVQQNSSGGRVYALDAKWTTMPGRDLAATAARDNNPKIRHILGMRQFPPRQIVCLTGKPLETLYRLAEQDRMVGVSGYAVRPPQVRREKPRVSAFISADIPKILKLEPDLVLAFSDLQAGIVADLVRAGGAIHVFNQRDIAGILAMIRNLGALVGAAERADQLAAGYERRLAGIASMARPLPKPKVHFEEWDDPLISG